MVNSSIICVLGMARSGTSLTTKILDILGVYLGPEDHMHQDYQYNQKGCWEHRLFYDINVKILTKLACSNWQTSTPSFPSGWESSSEFDKLKEQARSVIKRDFANVPVWGWKDPKTCLTLSFWQSILPHMKYVICLRNPIDVTRSASRMFGYSAEQGVYLWLCFLKSAIEGSVRRKRIFIFYENWFNDLSEQLQGLARFLEMAEQAQREDVKSSVQKFIDPKLSHYGAFNTYENYENTACIPTNILSIIQPLYESIRYEKHFNQSIVCRRLQEAIDDVRKCIHDRWMKRLHLATQELESLISAREKFILVDDEQWGNEVIKKQHAIPFLEKNGRYWGSPQDDDTAIQELERLRRSGASFIVFGWPAFWWLDHYTELNRYLRERYRCVLQNDRLIMFNLRT